jgi:hypothetical protein
MLIVGGQCTRRGLGWLRRIYSFRAGLVAITPATATAAPAFALLLLTRLLRITLLVFRR